MRELSDVVEGVREPIGGAGHVSGCRTCVFGFSCRGKSRSALCGRDWLVSVRLYLPIHPCGPVEFIVVPELANKDVPIGGSGPWLGGLVV